MAHKQSTGKTPVVTPVFRNLSREEIDSVLACNHVGRIAFSFRDHVDIRPVHYVFDEQWLFGRTSPGDKLVTLQHHQWVAFEVEEVSGPFEWKSIVAHGTFHRLEPGGPPPAAALYERARAAIGRLVPDAFTDADRTPFRSEVFGIFLDSVTGRAASTAKSTR